MITAVVSRYNFFYINTIKLREYEKKKKKVTAVFWQLMFIKYLINVRLKRITTILL